MCSPSSRVTFSFVVSSRLRLRCLLVLVSPPSYALRPSGVPSLAFLHPPPHPHSHSRSVLCRHRSSPSLLFPLPPHVLPCLAVALRLQFAQPSAAPFRVAPLALSLLSLFPLRSLLRFVRWRCLLRALLPRLRLLGQPPLTRSRRAAWTTSATATSTSTGTRPRAAPRPPLLRFRERACAARSPAPPLRAV